jgi:hypothetical protein
VFPSWTGNCLRTLELTYLSLSLPFEQFGSPTTFTTGVVDIVLITDRETLATVIDLLEHQYQSSASSTAASRASAWRCS